MPIALDANKVRHDFYYCPESGLVFRKGRVAGYIHNGHMGKQYIRMCAYKTHLYAHRIAWVWMTGQDPEYIDHIDGDGTNNKWSNLRSVSHAQNTKNQKLHSTNTSGTMGVTWRKDSGKWRARITVDGVKINLGTFATKDAAIAAREKSLKKYGFHENHGKRIAA